MVAAALLVIAGAVVPAQTSSPANAAEFDFDTGNAFLEVMVPKARPAFRSAAAPNPSDASLVLRITTLLDGAMFDAIAPYHPTAVGVYSRLGRRPAEESATNRNKNIAILYVAHRMLSNLLPGNEAVLREMLTSVGLDPDDMREDRTSPIGLGNLAAKSVIEARLHDGMNQLGDEGGRRYNRQPYADYTGYKPVNTAYELRDPSRWQPLLLPVGNGTFRIQQFVTPQMGRTDPYSYEDVADFRVPPPRKSDPRRDPAGYRAQANEVLAVSAGLTDEQKAVAELFDNKFISLAASQYFVSLSRGHSLDQFIQLAFLTNLASFDTAIAVWSEKYRYDAVRPVSAIRYLYGDRKVTAWGGPGKGTVSDITGNEWRSYLNTADHPEYPSGSSGLCAAHTQAIRLFVGSDDFGWSVPVAKGSSVVEPGVTPKEDITLSWSTLSEFSHDCGQSRLWGGVHFQSAITAARPIGHVIGTLAYAFVQEHIDGTAR